MRSEFLCRFADKSTYFFSIICNFIAFSIIYFYLCTRINEGSMKKRTSTTKYLTNLQASAAPFPLGRGRGWLFCIMSFLAIVCCPAASAQSTHWLVEAESPQTRILLRADTLDITSPQGLSLWWDQPVAAPCVIEYRACVVMEGGPFDRLSDLNCFWMASEPAELTLSPLRGIDQRRGRFPESYRLQCYYLGYGGNHNTTTRFRRYDADTLAVADPSRRPAILQEYTDSAHLLRPNHWYDIRIEVTPEDTAARVRYSIDGTLLVDYLDPHPLLRGWFAFRTPWSHTRLTAFRISPAPTTRQ